MSFVGNWWKSLWNGKRPVINRNINPINFVDNWPSESPKWPQNYMNMASILKEIQLALEETTPPVDMTLKQFLETSEKFPLKFATEEPRCYRLKCQEDITEKQLEDNIKSVYPLIHEKAFELIAQFFDHHRKFGSKTERELYKKMNLIEFIDRLLIKRAAVFIGALDRYLLMDGTEGVGNGSWEEVGTDTEAPPLTLENCLSYDEMKLSAFLSVSSQTIFLNDGNRYNDGVPAADLDVIQRDGVIIGLIGARLRKDYVMEYRECVKSREQNNAQYGYGTFEVPTWQGHVMNFYGDTSMTYRELDQINYFRDNPERFKDMGSGKYFDRVVYSRRIALSIDTLLMEADSRGRDCQVSSYVHLVGLGLGVWRLCEGQDEIFMDTVARRIELLGNHLHHISDVCFAYFRAKTAKEYSDGQKVLIEGHPQGGITLHMRNRNPHDKLTGPDEGKLLVVSYAWDSNSLPGNEFWFGSLNSSGDPAAAASTQVAEIHNAHINPILCGRNLRIASLNGLLTIDQYLKLHLND